MKKTQVNKIYFIYFVVILTFVMLRIASSLGAFNLIKNATILSLATSVIIQIGILFILPLILIRLILKKKPQQVFKEFRFKRPTLKTILISFGIGILACILNFFVAFIFSAIITMLGYEGMRSLTSGVYSYNTLIKFLVGVFCVGILPAFCEEFLHRGFVLNETKNHLGFKRAIIFSSILFGLMHLNITQVFYAIILGLIMGYIAVASDNIWPAVIMHFTNNFINVYLDFASVKNLPFGGLNDIIFKIFSNDLGIGLILSSIIIFLAVFGIVYLIALLFKETRYKELENKFNKLQHDMATVAQDGLPLTPEEAKIGFEIYYKQSFKNINSIVDLMIPKTEGDKAKLTLKNSIFFIATLILGIVITYFTFIWGVF